MTLKLALVLAILLQLGLSMPDPDSNPHIKVNFDAEINGGCCCDEKSPITVECPYPFQPIFGCCYYFSLPLGDAGRKNWHDARRECEKMKYPSSGLAQVGTVNHCNDVEFMDVVASKEYKDPLGGDGIYWFGATNMDLDGKWLWQRPGATKYFSQKSNMWEKDEPQGHEKCLFAWITTKYKRAYFEDAVCEELYHYVCQLF